MGFAHWRRGSILIHFVQGLDGIVFFDGLCDVIYVCLKMLLLHRMEKLVSIKLVYNQEVTSHQQTSVYSHLSKNGQKFTTCFFWGWMVVPDSFWRLAKVTSTSKRSFGSTWFRFMLPTNTWEIMSCLPNEEGEEFHTCFHHVYLAKTTYGKGWFIHNAQLKLPTYGCTPVLTVALRDQLI